MCRLKFLLLCSFCLLMAFVYPSYAGIATYTFNVNVTTDTVDANPADGICADAGGNCSLRAAIMEANALSAATVTINVPAGTYNLTITYGAEEDGSASNDLDAINSGSTTITGAGTGQDVVINASAIAHRVFDVRNGANLTLNNLTITGGYSSVAGGGIRVASGATLNLDHVIITNNASRYGGGIYNEGAITGNLVSITSNTVSESSACGGGIYLSGGTNNSVTLTRSLISGNSSTNDGGGVCNYGNGSYDSPMGGTLYLENVTIGQNSAGSTGAGVYLNQGSRSYFVNCTIAYNTNPTASNGAGIAGGGATSFDFLNTLVFQNTGYGGVNNCYQIYNSSSSINWNSLNPAYFNKGVPFGHNLEDNYGPGNDQSYCFGNNSYSSNILLNTSLTTSAALAGVGTYKLQTGSMAIDAGDPANFAALDVFGTTRPQGSNPDIGAYEFTDDNEPPTKPVLTNPSSGRIVFGNRVSLYWEKSTDPEGGNVTYRLQIADDAGFTTNLQTFALDGNGILLAGMMLPFLPLIGWGVRNRRTKILMLLMAAMLMATSLFVGCSGGGSYINNDNAVSFEVTGLDSGKTYYWRVIAVDENDAESEPSETRSFVVN